MTATLSTTSHLSYLTSLAVSPLSSHLATSSLDHSILIRPLPLDPAVTETPIKAHDAPVLCLGWAPATAGVILASGGADGLVKVWSPSIAGSFKNNSSNSSKSTLAATKSAASKPAWVARATLSDARGTVRSLAFSLAAKGGQLLLAVVSSDSHLRVYGSLDPVGLSEWSLDWDIDLLSPIYASLPNAAASNAGSSSGGGASVATGQQHYEGGNAAASSWAQGQGQARAGKVESDGAWAVSWLKEKWWGDRLAVSAAGSPVVHLFHLLPHRAPHRFLALPPPSSSSNTSPISSLSFAPPSGRSYQLLAASSSRGGLVRIWRVWMPPSLGEEEDDEDEAQGEEGEWKAEVEQELEGGDGGGETKVEWNITGTVLAATTAASGNGAMEEGQVVRLWKSSYTGTWKVVATLGSKEEEDGDNDEGMVILDD